MRSKIRVLHAQRLPNGRPEHTYRVSIRVRPAVSLGSILRDSKLAWTINIDGDDEADEAVRKDNEALDTRHDLP